MPNKTVRSYQGVPIKVQTFTAVIHREEDLYVATCRALGTVSKGATIEDALAHLKEFP
ncbi:MAG TPA: type II toxin-antitoxin system HicB family antitoxin [Terriglobia bacterium]|nr:type II toxin-antitoxin system HicB family antitoxin [Terriglobia bacterium]